MDNAFLAGKKLLGGSYTEYTPSGKGNFVKMGCWGKEPKVGAIPYFYSPTMGRVAHVGAVIKVNKKGDVYNIVTIEGNTSAGFFNRNGGCVAVKSYEFSLGQVGGSNRINGFGYPLFDDDTCTVEEFIEVLKGEVGYVEKASNRDLESKTANPGDKNYTKYGAWYGDNGAYWCQQFISYCAYMACKRHKKEEVTGWEQVQGKWKYKLHGQYVKGQWLEIAGRWYVFDEAGNAIEKWFKQDEDWYYLNPTDSAMLAGQWLQIDYNYYYLTRSGVMARNTYIKDTQRNVYCWVGADGKYLKEYDSTNPNIDKYGVAE